MAPDWLLDDDGEVRPEYAADYEARGRRRTTTEQRALDEHDAFANLAPTADVLPSAEVPAAGAPADLLPVAEPASA